jgi:hypothetical protein
MGKDQTAENFCPKIAEKFCPKIAENFCQKIAENYCQKMTETTFCLVSLFSACLLKFKTNPKGPTHPVFHVRSRFYVHNSAEIFIHKNVGRMAMSAEK